MKKLLNQLALVAACSSAIVATAQPITFNVDVGGVGQIYSGLAIAPDPAGGTNWNNMAINGLTSLTISNVFNSFGTNFPGVNITVSNVAGGASTMNTFDTTGNTTPVPLALMRDYSFFVTYGWRASGLAPGNYDLYFYGHGDAVNQGGVLRIAAPYGAYTNTTSTTSPLARDLSNGGLPLSATNGGLGISYLIVTNLTVGSDGLLGWSVVNYCNGFQLRPSQPEGPAFLLTGADSCSATVVGVAGSVTTNDYMLYTNNVYAGQTVAGTGSAISFGSQSAIATYTVVATNSTTATFGLMYGKVVIYTPGIVLSTQPTNLTLVTNLPASFAVSATGASLSYKWYKGGVPLTNGVNNVSGVTTPTLSISAVQAANEALTTNVGYTVVVQNPCGESSTSAPPATLTLLAPRDLIWAGGNPGSSWNFTDLEFLLSGSPTNFGEGDLVTFNDSSAIQSVVISNNMTPTLVTVTGTVPYTFSGPSKLTGITKLVQASAGTLTIVNENDFTGGTTINSGSSLTISDGTTPAKGSLGGVVTVSANSTITYGLNANGSGSTTAVLLKNTLAGSGTNEVSDPSGGTINTATTGASSNFTGVVNVRGFTSFHASDNNAGSAFGNGSTVNVEPNAQAWVDRSATTYNNTFNIQGNGWQGSTPNLGAIRMFGSTITGPINMLANSRIGGSISGGTINSGISGPYQLEILGSNPTSFVLQMNPTNGSHTYASTLITAGIIQANNANAISKGPLTIDNAGTLRLNGNNLSVSNLTSLNTATIAGAGAIVVNNHATVAAVLTVGAAGDTFQYDGFFANGAAATLGLTKAGSGTFTVTTLASNTGPVTVTGGTLALTGSGLFNFATNIIIGSGAFYDVSAAGGTLALTSGRTLTGNGTLTGTLSAPAGTFVNPGLLMGTLAVSGSATVNGTYTANLNRTNTPSNCSQMTAGGGLTFSGATLNISNIGPAFQAGDLFQLFPGATAGFSTINLPTLLAGYDLTWTNRVAIDGSVQVLTAAPAVADRFFRTIASGNWSATNSWERSVDGVVWAPTTLAPDFTASNILVRASHSVTNVSIAIVDQVTVESNATVVVTTGNLVITNGADAVDCSVSGNLKMALGTNSLSITAGAGLSFTSGGQFDWARTNTAPVFPTATWQDGSTCRVSATAPTSTTATGFSGQSYYDFIWNTVAVGQVQRTSLAMQGTNTVVRRDLTITLPDTANASVAINNATNGLLTVARHVTLTGGTNNTSAKVLLSAAAGNSWVFKIAGNLQVAGYLDAITTGSLIQFNGTGAQSLSLTTNPISGNLISWLVDSTSSLSLGSKLNVFNTFTNNGTLSFGANTLSGGSALVLGASGTVNGNGTNLLVSAVGTNVNGGTLNLGALPSFTGGESFKVISATNYSGTFATLLPATPGGAFTWDTSQLNTAGILTVSGAAPTPTNITFTAISGTQQVLNWPAGQGWKLETQTNSRAIGLWTNWVVVPGATPPYTNTVDPTAPTLFFRLSYP